MRCTVTATMPSSSCSRASPGCRISHAEAAGSSFISFIVDHIFLCTKDAEFQLELLMQSLFFSRASISDGESSKNLSCIKVAGLFLRDTFSCPPCTLIQPSVQAVPQECLPIPDFGHLKCKITGNI